MAKMKDVAWLAGVSTATVSRVLSGDKKVSEKTKRKVLQAVQQLNYSPNRLASNLRQLRSKTVMVIVRDIMNTFFSDVIRGVEDEAQRNGYHVLLGDTQNDPQKEIDFIELHKQKIVDGVIWVAPHNKRDIIEEVAKELSVVLASEFLDRVDMPMVTIDNISAARQATDHLVSLGHRRIGFISGPLNLSISRDRLKGYRQSLLQKEISIQEEWIQEGDWSIESGYNMTRRLMALESPPTAIFAANDEMAVGAIKALKEKGFRVPQDVAVVGFDNIKLASVVEPALTTVSQPKYEIGRKAMELLLKVMNGEAIPRQQFILTCELIVRESCGASLRSLSTM